MSSTPSHASGPEVGATLAAAGFLGPAMVTAVGEDQHCSCLVDGVARSVRLAMPLLYRPVVGDVLLVIGAGDQDQHYAIGLIQGRGAISLATEGSIDVQAGGALRLKAGAELQLDSPRTRVRGRRVELEAEHLVTTARDWVARIKGLLKLGAGRRSAHIEGSDTTRSGSIDTRAKGRLSLDGERIDLG